MRKTLALDISTKTGYALFDSEVAKTDIKKSLLSYGLLKNPKKVLEYGEYPWAYINAAAALVDDIINLIKQERPAAVCIEETNGGGRANRYSLKILEFLHCTLLTTLQTEFGPNKGTDFPIVAYINSSEWRKSLGLSLSSQDKINNKKLNNAKTTAALAKGTLDKSKLGIKGKITKKHIAVRYANATFGLDLKIKDNDIADAICIGNAFLNNCHICDGR